MDGKRQEWCFCSISKWGIAMIRKYVLDRWNRTLHALQIPSYRAPGHHAAGMISSPMQSVQQAPREPQCPQTFGPQTLLFDQLRHQTVVKQIPVKQREYILHAPPVPAGPKRTDTIDRRRGIAVDEYPQQLARQTYMRGAYEAPPSQQSIPGYVLYNGKLVTPQKKKYGAMRAPKVQVGG